MDINAQLEAAARSLEERLNIPYGFFKGLRDEGDWSFVIQAHALIEAVLADTISTSLERPELQSVIAQTPTSNTRYGKIALAKELALLDDQDTRFIREISAIRNSLVHDVKNVKFNFNELLKGKDHNQQAKFARDISFVSPDQNKIDGVDLDEIINGVLDDPKTAVWYSLMFFIAKVYLQDAFFPLFLAWILLAYSIRESKSKGTS